MHSDWGDWLLREVERTTPDRLTCWYLGCNGFIVKAADGTTVFVDPYLGLGDPPRTVRMIPVPFDAADVRECDAVLATHEHTDHTHGPSQAPMLAATGAPFFGTDASLAVADEEGWTDEWDVWPDQLHEVAEGDTLEFGDVTVHVEPANDPDAAHPVSYVFEYDDLTFFHGGDARPGEPFEDVGSRYDVDVGVLAFGSDGYLPDKRTREPTYTKWYADENEIVEAAGQLGLDTLVPTHWDMWKGLTADPTALFDHARGHDHPRDVRIVEIGDAVRF